MVGVYYMQIIIFIAIFASGEELEVAAPICKECITSAGSTPRCFYMPPQNLTWEGAQEQCSARGNASFLAADDSKAAHDALHTVMMANKEDKAWIGGKVKGLYWNWTPSKFDTGRRRTHKLYVQGCYDVGAVPLPERKTQSVVECQKQCIQQNTSYFILRKPDEGMNPFKCQCSDSVQGNGSLHCYDCVNDTSHLCGGKDETAAIYSVNHQPSRRDNYSDYEDGVCQSRVNRWRLWEKLPPVGVNDTRGCMTFSKGPVNCRRWMARDCSTVHKPVVCSSGTANATCPQNFTKKGGYCYTKMNLTWAEAIEACSDNHELVAVYDDSIRREIEDFLEDLTEFWIRGTSRRWLWQKEAEVLENVTPPTNDTLEPPPFDERCLVITLVNGSARWNSSKCAGQPQSFLCETSSTDFDNIPICSTIIETIISTHPSAEVTTSQLIEKVTSEGCCSAAPVHGSPQLPLIIGATLGCCLLLLLLVILACCMIARRRTMKQKTNSSHINDPVIKVEKQIGQASRKRETNDYQKCNGTAKYKKDKKKKERKEKKAKKGTVLHHLLFIKAAAKKHKEIHTERVSCENHKGIFEEEFHDYETVQYDQIYAIPQKKKKPKVDSKEYTEEENIYQLVEPLKQAIDQTLSEDQRIPVKDLILLFNEHIKTLKTKEEKTISDLAVAVLPRGDDTEMVANDIYNLIPEDLSRSLKATHAQQAEIFRQQEETDLILEDLQMMENDIYVAVEDIYAIPMKKNKVKISETIVGHDALKNSNSDKPTGHIREMVETSFGLQQKVSVKELIDLFENHKTKLQEKRQEALLGIADTFVEQATHMEENVLYGESPWMAEAGNALEGDYEILDLQDNPIYISHGDSSSEGEEYEEVSFFEFRPTAEGSNIQRDQIDAVVNNLRKMKHDSVVSFNDTGLDSDSIRKRVQGQFGDTDRIPVRDLITMFNKSKLDFKPKHRLDITETPGSQSSVVIANGQSDGLDGEDVYAEITDDTDDIYVNIST